MKYLVVMTRDLSYSESAEAIVEAETEEAAKILALNEVDPDFRSWSNNRDLESEGTVSSVSGAPEDAEYSRLIGDPRSLAEEAGWRESPDGRWWRDIAEGEPVPEKHVAPFLGSDPFVWADSAEDACEFDELEQS